MQVLRGKVMSGLGNFGIWIAHLADLYEVKTGMRFYPGTLNLELPEPYSLPSDAIRLEAAEYSGRVSVSLVPCRIFDRPAFLLRTDENERGIGHHPRTVIEIATDICLRDAFSLRDGDWIQVEVD
jgi:CTP-dependent riboflavin kinase